MDLAIETSGKAAAAYQASGFPGESAVETVAEAESIYNKYTKVSSVSLLDRAEQLLQDAIPHLPDQPGYKAHANLLRAAVEYSRAVNDPSDAQLEWEEAVKSARQAVKLFRQVPDGAYNLTDALSHLGAIEVTAAVYLSKGRTASEEEGRYQEGMSDLAEAAKDCAGFPALCFDVHKVAAESALFWATHWGGGSSPFTEGLNRAEQEWQAASEFISPQDQAGLFGWTKERSAETYQKLAIYAEGVEQELLLTEARDELTEGLEVVTAAGCSTADLYAKRAECFHRMYTYARDPNSGKAYLALEAQDKNAAKHSTTAHTCPGADGP
jgi:hypothetical protein